MNFSRATFVLLAAALVLMAAVHWQGRTQDRESFKESRNALNELRAQVESQNQLLAELRLRLAEQELRSSVAPPSATATDAVNEPLNRILAMLHQQSNALAVVRSQIRVPSTESPEERRERAEAGILILQERYEEQQHKLKSALEQLDALRVSLGIPDEIAGQNDAAAAYDSRLMPYRAFFEARRSYEQEQRFAQILSMKLAAERIDASLPVSR
jgi:hypothetical protein